MQRARDHLEKHFRLQPFYFLVALFTCALAFISCSSDASAVDLNKTIAENQLDVGPFSSPIKVTYFGSSSFLIEDANTQILIDGFVTRKNHNYVRRIAPDESRIRQVIRDHNICPNRAINSGDPVSDVCKITNPKKLELILPAHGHYDHVLDAPYFAAWAGASLVCDESVSNTVEANKDYSWIHKVNWESIKTFPKGCQNSPTKFTRHMINVGKFKVTLFKATHLKNILSGLAGSTTKKSLKLPARLIEFGEGTNWIVKVTHGHRSMLIVSSAGLISKGINSGELNADVMFLGIGGLGAKWFPYRKKFLRQMFHASNAKRIVPIHWDTDQVKLRANDTNFRPARPFLLSRALDSITDFNKTFRKEIIFAPAEQAFDPFLGLN